MLNVIDDVVPEALAWTPDGVPIAEMEPLRDELERNSIAATEKLIPDEARTSCSCEARARFGQAPREILRIAAEQDAELIVMGTPGRGALNRVLFGSTAPQVVHQATCPVVVVSSGHRWPSTALARKDDSRRMVIGSARS